MQIYNQTRFVSEFTMGMDKEGREHLSLVVKGTFDFPQESRHDPQPSQEQTPLVMADEFTGEPGYSATLWESDFAFRKRHCDVILNGCAYAPGGNPTKSVRVGLKVGQWSKMFDVFGPRQWRTIGPAVMATDPVPFYKQRFTYDNAFGGVDKTDPDDTAPPAYLRNPVGVGWAAGQSHAMLPGLALPNTQAIGEDVASPYRDYTPMSFGPVARGEARRLGYAGTYDQNWIDNVFPFLPADFDERYFQMASKDQQVALPARGTQVVLGNLTPNGREEFRLPDTDLPLTIFRKREKVFDRAVRPARIPCYLTPRRESFRWSGASTFRSTASLPNSPKPGLACQRTRCCGRARPGAAIFVPLLSPKPKQNERASRNSRRRDGNRGGAGQGLILCGNARQTGRLSGNPVCRVIG